MSLNFNLFQMEELWFVYHSSTHFMFDRINNMFPCDIEALKEGKMYINVIGKCFFFCLYLNRKLLSNEAIWSLNPIASKGKIKYQLAIISRSQYTLSSMCFQLLYNRNIFSPRFSPSKASSFSSCLASSKRFILLIDCNQ